MLDAAQALEQKGIEIKTIIFIVTEDDPALAAKTCAQPQTHLSYYARRDLLQFLVNDIYNKKGEEFHPLLQTKKITMELLAPHKQYQWSKDLSAIDLMIQTRIKAENMLAGTDELDSDSERGQLDQVLAKMRSGAAFERRKKTTAICVADAKLSQSYSHPDTPSAALPTVVIDINELSNYFSSSAIFSLEPSMAALLANPKYCGWEEKNNYFIRLRRALETTNPLYRAITPAIMNPLHFFMLMIDCVKEKVDSAREGYDLPDRQRATFIDRCLETPELAIDQKMTIIFAILLRRDRKRDVLLTDWLQKVKYAVATALVELIKKELGIDLSQHEKVLNSKLHKPERTVEILLLFLAERVRALRQLDITDASEYGKVTRLIAPDLFIFDLGTDTGKIHTVAQVILSVLYAEKGTEENKALFTNITEKNPLARLLGFALLSRILAQTGGYYPIDRRFSSSGVSSQSRSDTKQHETINVAEKILGISKKAIFRLNEETLNDGQQMTNAGLLGRLSLLSSSSSISSQLNEKQLKYRYGQWLAVKSNKENNMTSLPFKLVVLLALLRHADNEVRKQVIVFLNSTWEKFQNIEGDVHFWRLFIIALLCEIRDNSSVPSEFSAGWADYDLTSPQITQMIHNLVDSAAEEISNCFDSPGYPSMDHFGVIEAEVKSAQASAIMPLTRSSSISLSQN
jgi:hypothetical protein